MLRNTRLKEKLIKSIRDIDNGEILNQIARLVHFEEKFDEVYIMSPEEIAAVEDGMRQIENGEWISDEESNKHVDEWLNKYNNKLGT
jgi:predicted transcriptional regulator